MAKGASFEREIAKELSLWWSGGAREDIFYRSHSSGGRFTQRKKSGKDTALQGGDITCSDPDGELLIKNWNIECKTGYGAKTKASIVRWDVLDFIDSKQKEPTLRQMWEQCERDAYLTQREPILIFRRNNRNPCIMITIDYRHKLRQYFNAANYYSITIVYSENNCCIMNLSDFLSWIPNIRSALCQ